jgi:hypothetical protein
MCTVTDDYVGRVVKTGSDKEMGRWSFVQLLGKHGRNIMVVSAYQVCNQQAARVGDRTAFAQQLSLLCRNGKDCSPRKSFFDDIDKQTQEWIGKGYKILLSGDFNEVLGADVNGFTRISAKWNLLEIIQHFSETDGQPPTYTRGTRRLDYIFCTSNLLSRSLMGGDLAVLLATPVRILRATDVKGREKYVKAVAKYMEDHMVLQRLLKVTEATTPNVAKIEAIHRDISRAMAYAINQISRVYASPFSPQVKKL